jgi:hypothetical protein
MVSDLQNLKTDSAGSKNKRYYWALFSYFHESV